jgi:hypothetical protein
VSRFAPSRRNWPAAFYRDGLSRDTARARALQADYFQPDELNINQLISLMSVLAEQVHYIGDSEQHDPGSFAQANWRPLFDNSELVTLAQIAAVDCSLSQHNWQALAQQGQRAQRSFVQQLLQQLDRWYRQLLQADTAPAALLADKLSSSWQQHLAKLPAPLAHASQIKAANSLFQLSQAENKTADASLASCCSAALHLLRYLQQQSAQRLQALWQEGETEPALALLLSFLKLYQQSQQRLNCFSKRHQLFYYDDCLQMPAQSVPQQQLWLSLSLSARAQPVLLEADSRFSAGKDSSGNAILFRNSQPLWLSNARLQQICSVSLLSSQRISPEHELMFVSRMYSSVHQVSPDKPQALFTADDSCPRLPGFAIVSPVLLLTEGERSINVQLQLELNQSLTAEFDSLPDRLLQCERLQDFFPLFGQLFSYYLFGPEQGLTAEYTSQLLAKATELCLGASTSQSLHCIRQLLQDDRMTLFYRYCSNLFLLQISTEEGFTAIAEYSLQPLAAEQPTLQLRCQLGSNFAAVTADNEGRATLQILLNPAAKLCGYSLCSQFDLVRCKVEVRVTGLRQLNLNNQLGPVDNSKPFWPFGPVPTRGSYLLFNHAEWQYKQLQQVELQLNWAGLPEHDAGFAGHYAGYVNDNQPQLDNPSFQAQLDVLDNGQWLPLRAEPGGRVGCPLFATEHDSDRLLSQQQIILPDVRAFRLDKLPAGAAYHSAASNGFFRLRLSAPAMAFGHSRYAGALSDIMLYNARHKKVKPPPQPPYVPQLASLTLNYCANTDIYTRQDPASDKRDQLLQLYPFGQRLSYPSAQRSAVSLIPYFSHQAYVCFGLTGIEQGGRLSLLFDIEAARGSSDTVPQDALYWQYLHNDSWQDLPKQALVSDSSYGLSCSGMVVLQLPQLLQSSHQLMPTGMAWLRLCCPAHSRSYGRLRRVLTNAVAVEAVDSAHQLTESQLSATEPLQWQCQPKVAGLDAIDAVIPLQKAHAAESQDDRLQRIAQRLSHKQRACTAHDFERLVLQAFPELYKVKCFANASTQQGQSGAGRLLLVVLAANSACQHSPCNKHLVSGELLRQIRHYVSALASPFAHIEVANPGFDQLQVRCAVKLSSSARLGDGIQLLQRELADYLCPWAAHSPLARFGWELRPQLVKSFIRQRPYVEFVTDFSLLHISDLGSRRYELQDSACFSAVEQLVLTPVKPWHLLQPASKHALTLLSQMQTVAAQPTGIGELEIGQTFIISQEAGDG